MRSLLLAVLLCFASPACTLCKPVVCAVTTPILLLGDSGVGPSFAYGCSDGAYGVGAALGLASVVGVVVGLVTGIVNDFNVVTGRVERRHAADNLVNPFLTNDR